MLFKGSAYDFILVGLGNPGSKYTATRHNAGFMAAEYIRQKLGAGREKLKFKALCSEAVMEGKRVMILKPQTYMNLSGESVREAAAFYKVPMDRVIVIYDDVSLDMGRLRIRERGSDGGHNGIKNIILHCNTDVFPRIKIGVGGKPHPGYDLADWVLGELGNEEKEQIFGVLQRVYEACGLMVGGKIREAMNSYNR